MTPEAIAAVIERKSLVHPELHAPLRWDGLLRVLQREGVILARVPLDWPGQLFACEGMWILLINSDAPARRHTYIGAHELGHLWLHTDGDAWTPCYQMTVDWPDDPREDDAELFAQMVLGLV